MRFSPDGLYYWDGTRWLSALSHDGQFRWDGRTWVPLQRTYMPVQASQDRPPRQPSSWTRPLQLAVAGWYAISALYTLSVPFWMGGLMAQVVNQSFQRQESLNPSVSPPPPGFVDSLVSMMTWVVWFGVIFGVAICLLAIVAAIRRWTWAYYAIMALLGLGILSLPGDLTYLAGGPALSQVGGGVSLPVQIYVLGAVAGVAEVGLFTFMVVALVKRGPWGMVRPAA